MFELKKDPWLSQFFEGDVARVSFSQPDLHHDASTFSSVIPASPSVIPVSPSVIPAKAGIQKIKQNLNDYTLTYAKVPVEDIQTLEALTSKGFQLIDTNVSLAQKTVPAHSPTQNKKLTVRQATPTDQPAVERIAEESFVYTRFHLDPNIDNSIANKIKRGWVTSYFTGGRGDNLIVSEWDGEVTGFLTFVSLDTDPTVDLIAVHPTMQGRGSASAMMRWGNEAYGPLKIGTQIANASSIRLYQKHGFYVMGASYVLHRHGK